ncbi:hypothetical protein PINS_up005244 [Pythium insidiosum]|nr:hypothetical protein PINS_up005244 [Pythium insidiosum]
MATAASTAAATPSVSNGAVPTTATSNGNSNGSSAATTAAPGPAVSEAERLRNDFNSQYSRLYYGCSIALELFNGHLMMVNCADGRVGVQALEKMQLKGASATTTGRHRAVFTLIDLADVRSANAISSVLGTGEFSWEQGGVLGAKVREAPQLKALALADDDSIRNDVPAPAVVGYPVPIRAYLPKTRDDADAQVDELQSRVRNKASKMLGKWVIRSAVQNRRKSSDNFVYNNDEIYLEQDWFYLGADSDAGVAVLRQLPPASALRDIKSGEYVIERRAAWRIRLLDSSNGSTGLSLAQQQMERLLLRAKNQLKQSRKMRAGQVRSYGADLQSGVTFVPQLRTQLAAATRQCDARYLQDQERRLAQLPTHLTVKADAMNDVLSDDPALMMPTDFDLPVATRRQSVVLPPSVAQSTSPPAAAACCDE